MNNKAWLKKKAELKIAYEFNNKIDMVLKNNLISY